MFAYKGGVAILKKKTALTIGERLQQAVEQALELLQQVLAEN